MSKGTKPVSAEKCSKAKGKLLKSAKVLKVLEVLDSKVLAVPIIIGGSGDQRSEVAVSA